MAQTAAMPNLAQIIRMQPTVVLAKMEIPVCRRFLRLIPPRCFWQPDQAAVAAVAVQVAVAAVQAAVAGVVPAAMAAVAAAAHTSRRSTCLAFPFLKQK